MTVARARWFTQTFTSNGEGNKFLGCDQKTDDIVACETEFARGGDAMTCQTTSYVKQPTFQTKVQVSSGVVYCWTANDQSDVQKIQAGTPSEFHTPSGELVAP